MRILLLLFFFVLLYAEGNAQTTGGFGSNSQRMIPMTNLGSSEVKDDLQARFLRQEWSPGVVSFRNSTNKWQVPVIFDIYSNKIYFLQDKQILEFADTVYEALITIGYKTDSTRILFRSFYPPVNQNTAETLYEVMVDGQFQLLRCRAKSIYLYKEQNIPEDQRRYNKELLYAYFPGKQIVLIKKDKEELLAQVPPEYSAEMKSIIESKKIKVKNEEGMKQLFRVMNEEK